MDRNTFIQLCFGAVCLSLAPQHLSALPSKSKTVSGTAEIKKTSPSSMDIRTSDKAVIHYKSFDIGKREKVRFLQDSASSCVLNRITGEKPSSILGHLESNGKVFLVNPQGIYFGPESTVQVGSLIASTLDLADQDFLEGNYQFFWKGNPSAKILNEGSIISSGEGSIVLLSPQIKNTGHIEASAGTVVLASGSHVTLDFAGDGLVQFAVEGSIKEALIEHLGEIKGSHVFLQIPTAKQAISNLINVEGAEEGDVFIEEEGIIKLSSASKLTASQLQVQGTRIEVQGNIDASDLSKTGGMVHLFGKEIFLQSADINVSGGKGGGEVLIGGEFQGQGKTPHASIVSMDESSQITASAIEEGQGGTVVLWSRDQTSFNGQISSQGGVLKGDGGLVETSSSKNLVIQQGKVNTFAPQGTLGTWLLDPDIINIVSGSGNSCGGSNPYGNCGGTLHCSIGVDVFNSSASSVTIFAQNSMTVSTPIIMTQPSAGITLGCTSPISPAITLDANIITNGGPILINNGISGLGTNLTLDTTAGGTNTAGANVTCQNLFSSFDGGYSLTVNGGTTGTVTVGTELNSTSDLLSSITVTNAQQILTNNLTVQNSISLPSGVDLEITSLFTKILSNAGSIQIGGDIEGSGNNLTLGSGSSSSITISGSITGINNLLVSSGSQISLEGISGAGSLNITPPLLLTGSSPSISSSGSISFTGDVTLSGTGTASISSSGSSISFSGNLNGSSAGGQGVTLGAGTTLSLPSLIGNSNAFGSFSITSGSVSSFPTSISTTPNSPLTGNVSITPSVALSSPLTVTTNGGPISFSSITGGEDATLNAGSGTVSLGGPSTIGSLQVTAGNATVSGSLSATGISISNDLTLSGSDPSLTASSGGISIGGNTSLSGSGTASLTASSGTISLSGSLNASTAGIQALTLAAGSTITLPSTIGSTAALGGFAITSGSVSSFPTSITTIPSSSLGGSVSITPSINLSSNLSVTTNGGAITFGTVAGTGSETGAFSAGVGAVSFTSLSSFSSLDITGSTVGIGSLSSLGSATINNSGLMTLGSGSFTLSGTFSQTGTGDTNLGSNLTASGIGFATNLNLTATPITLNSGSGTLSLGGASSSASTALTLASTNSVSASGPLGSSSSPLGSVTVSSGASNDSFQSIYTTGAIEIHPPTTFTGSTPTFQSTSGLIEFFSPVTLGGSGTATVSSTSGNIQFDSTISGTQDLSIGTGTGTVTFSGDIGSTALNSFNVTSGSQAIFSLSSLITSGNINITPPATISSSSATIQSTSGTIAFTAVTGSGSGTCSFSTANQAISFTSLSSFSSLDITGSTVGIGSLSSIGSATINNSGLMTLGSGPFTLSGTFSQTGTGDTNLGSNLTASGIGFATNLNLTATPITLNSGSGTLSLGGASSSASTALTLTSTNSVSASGPLGSSSSPLGSVTVSSGASSAALQSIYTTGSISIFPPATINGSSSFIQSSTGAIEFSGPVTFNGTGTLTVQSSSGNISFDSTLSGAQDLVIGAGSGSVSIKGNVGSVPLNSLNISSGSRASLYNVTTSGNLSITPPVTILGSNTILQSTSGTIEFLKAVTLGGSGTVTVQSTNQNITFGSTISGAQGLVLNPGSGSITIGGAVGSGTPLSSFTVPNGSLATLSSIATTGTITITPPVFLNASSTIQSTNGGITFYSSISGNQSLTLKAGNGLLQLLDSVGTLASFTVLTASDVDLEDVTTYGAISVSPNITLSNASTTLTTLSNGSISLGTVNGSSAGDQSLTLSAGSGEISLGIVGGSIFLNNFLISSASKATIHSIKAGGSIAIDPPAILAASSTLDSSPAGGGPLTLASIDGSNAGTETLTLLSGFGEIFLTGDIGKLMPTGDIEMTGGEIEFSNSLVSAAGSHTYNSPVLLAKDIEFRSLGNISFVSTINPLSSGAPKLSLYLGDGSLVFSGSVGDAPLGTVSVFNSHSFSAQDIIASGLVVSGGLPSIYTFGDISLSGPEGIYFDGGPIFLGGSINAKALFFRSYGTISNLFGQQPINISDEDSVGSVSFNAIGGTIGSLSSPIQINTSDSFTVGAYTRAAFSGFPSHSQVTLIPSNPPCFVTFNQISIVDCTTQPTQEQIIGDIPLRDWYVPGLYSSWNNLSNSPYFEGESMLLVQSPIQEKTKVFFVDNSNQPKSFPKNTPEGKQMLAKFNQFTQEFVLLIDGVQEKMRVYLKNRLDLEDVSKETFVIKLEQLSPQIETVSSELSVEFAETLPLKLSR